MQEFLTIYTFGIIFLEPVVFFTISQLVWLPPYQHNIKSNNLGLKELSPHTININIEKENYLFILTDYVALRTRKR